MLWNLFSRLHPKMFGLQLIFYLFFLKNNSLENQLKSTFLLNSESPVFRLPLTKYVFLRQYCNTFLVATNLFPYPASVPGVFMLFLSFKMLVSVTVVTPSWKLLESWKINILSNFSWFIKVISVYYAFLGLLFLCMPNLWPKGFAHRKFQMIMINGSEIMTSSILKILCHQPPKYWTYGFFTHFHPKN